jgi:hypothetical protein
MALVTPLPNCNRQEEMNRILAATAESGFAPELAYRVKEQ